MHLSQRKIATRLGCSHTYVQKLIARGTITQAALNEKGRIDPTVALPEILASVDESISCITAAAAEWLSELRDGNVPAAMKQIAKAPAKTARKPDQKTTKRQPPKQPTGSPQGNSQKESITEANRRKAVSQANMQEMAEAEKRKELVNAREVELDGFARARQLRDAILAVPDRVAPILAAETDEHTVRQALDTELRTVLRTLAEDESANG